MSVYLADIINLWLNENWPNALPLIWNKQWLYCELCDIILFEVNRDKITIWIPDTTSPHIGYFMPKDISATDPEIFNIIRNEINTHEPERCWKKRK